MFLKNQIANCKLYQILNMKYASFVLISLKLVVILYKVVLKNQIKTRKSKILMIKIMQQIKMNFFSASGFNTCLICVNCLLHRSCSSRYLWRLQYKSKTATLRSYSLKRMIVFLSPQSGCHWTQFFGQKSALISGSNVYRALLLLTIISS